MVVTHLELELCYQGKKLRGFTCKLTRSPYGYLPESAWLIAAQILLPFLVAGLGMVAAGIVMDVVQVWANFVFVCLVKYICVHVCVCNICEQYPCMHVFS